MKHNSSSNFLQKFIIELKKKGVLPKNIEISSIGPVILASVYNEIQSDVITESIFTGMDTDPFLAVLKGLVEMIERMAFLNGKRKGLRSCETDRSDGFAAFPYGIIDENTQCIARKNAYEEAIERFVWSTWWDHHQYSHKLVRIFPHKFKSVSNRLLIELHNMLPLIEIFRVTPDIHNNVDTEVVIYLAFLEPFGVISGGAAGTKNDIESVNFRAVCELVRHSLAVRKIKFNNLIPATFYEKRLHYFAFNQNGSEQVKNRIQQLGQIDIQLPKLSIDESVPHSLNDLVYVHRCYFDNQPAFVGGELERLCL